MKERRLLLVSSSTVHGTGYLDHCEAAARELFEGCETIAFVPWALADHSGYARRVRERFAAMGLQVESLHESPDPVATVLRAEGIFIGGGNTFRLLARLQRSGVGAAIRRRVLRSGVPYMGTSAGSNVAGLSIRTTNDMPIAEPRTFEALRLAPIQLNPHYLDPDPASTHQGESRDQRLFEFLEDNRGPVVALREGAMLVVRGGSMRLEGAPGGKLFLAPGETRELPAGAVLDELLGEGRELAAEGGR